MSLGKLKKVDPREVWKHEAHDFTAWLAQNENLKELGDELGYTFVLLATEASVGGFNCDILAEVEDTKSKVVIENQLEITDHDHLGKLITYASGLVASVAIWIVRDVREEHRKAIDWLNEHTDDDIDFFLVKIEVLQIDESPYAPRFEVICRPNAWAQSVKDASAQLTLSETNRNQLDFWTQLKLFASEQKSLVRLQKPSPQHWMQMSIGSSQAHISLTINSLKGLIAAELYIYDNKELYSELKVRQQEIEKEFGEQLEWMELPKKKASRVKISTACDFFDQSKWPDYFTWLLAEAEKFYKVFPKYIKSAEQMLDPDSQEE